jgi:hypothetical protein
LVSIKLLRLLVVPSVRIKLGNSQKVDEYGLENVPGNIQVVEAPLDTLPRDWNGIGVATYQSASWKKGRSNVDKGLTRRQQC